MRIPFKLSFLIKGRRWPS